MENKVEVVALGATVLFEIVVPDNGKQRKYIVHYETDPNGDKELRCVINGEVCFGESSCIAPIADLERIKEALSEHLRVPVAELLKPARKEGNKRKTIKTRTENAMNILRKELAGLEEDTFNDGYIKGYADGYNKAIQKLDMAKEDIEVIEEDREND